MQTATKKLTLAAMVLLAASVMATSTAVADTSLDDELEEYWATERDMDVIQDRLYQRQGRFGAGLFFGVMPSEPFYHYYPVGLQANYYHTNALGFELSGSFMDGPLTRDNELMDFLRKNRQDSGFDPATDTVDRQLWRANALALWSPFYGKLAALQQKLIHFDFNLGGGLGAVGVERPNADRRGSETTVVPELALGMGVHVYVNDNITVRADGRGFLHAGPELPTTDGFFDRLNFPLEARLGVSYLF